MQPTLFENINPQNTPEKYSFEQLLIELFEAYYECRKNKRNTINALQFEVNYESNLIKLANQIYKSKYTPGKSICFVVNYPVKREIFAADFRDRVVHHYLINKLNPLFEKEFIYDSYSCRKKRGTLFGIKRVDKFIRSCSLNYQYDSYILKLDIKGFFMQINKDILFEKLQNFINQKYTGVDKNLIISLSKIIIYNNPTQNCIIKGHISDWKDLPPVPASLSTCGKKMNKTFVLYPCSRKSFDPLFPLFPQVFRLVGKK